MDSFSDSKAACVSNKAKRARPDGMDSQITTSTIKVFIAVFGDTIRLAVSHLNGMHNSEAGMVCNKLKAFAAINDFGAVGLHNHRHTADADTVFQSTGDDIKVFSQAKTRRATKSSCDIAENPYFIFASTAASITAISCVNLKPPIHEIWHF